MLEGSVDQYSIPQQEKQTSTISMIVGTSVLTLLLPTAAIALLELLDWSFGFRQLISSMLFSLTILSILLISGLNLIGFLKSDNLKMGAGSYLITISILNLLIRMSNLTLEREIYGMPWFDFMPWPMAHEQLELAFLGIIIGALIMKK